MQTTIKFFLNACSGILGVYIFSLAFVVLKEIWKFSKSKIKKTPPSKNARKLKLRDLLPSSQIARFIFVFVLLIGGVNQIAITWFSSTEIGAFYEKSEYTENFEAMIYPSEHPEEAFFCIAKVFKTRTRTEEDIYDYYQIEKLFLPLDRTSKYIDEAYNPTDDKNMINLGKEGIRCVIKLGKVADEFSYAKLENELFSNDGNVCASKKSNIYHYSDCRQVANIQKENLIYFRNTYEPQILGFEMCSECCK